MTGELLFHWLQLNSDHRSNCSDAHMQYNDRDKQNTLLPWAWHLGWVSSVRGEQWLQRRRLSVRAPASVYTHHSTTTQPRASVPAQAPVDRGWVAALHRRPPPPGTTLQTHMLSTLTLTMTLHRAISGFNASSGSCRQTMSSGTAPASTTTWDSHTDTHSVNSLVHSWLHTVTMGKASFTSSSEVHEAQILLTYASSVH